MQRVTSPVQKSGSMVPHRLSLAEVTNQARWIYRRKARESPGGANANVMNVSQARRRNIIHAIQTIGTRRRACEYDCFGQLVDLWQFGSRRGRYSVHT